MRAPKMLIVDSQQTIAETVAEIFVLSGYEVRAKYGGESALEAALEWQPNVAILEFILTGMNGLDCANELLGRHPDCKVILMYAQVAEYLIDAARARRYEVLAKPIDPKKLIATAGALLNERTHSK
jgi:two-component system OmpR family response regulator